MNASELFEALNLLDEHERIEAKRCRQVGTSVMETICAFANEPGLGGGWLLLGVQMEESALFPAYEVIGLEDPDRISADLASRAANDFNQAVRLEIQTELLHDKPVIRVFVPEAPAHDKPIFFRARGLPKGAFRRIGSTDHHCTEDDLLALLQGRQQESFDASIAPDTTLEDLNPEAIDEYRRARAETNPDAEELGWSDHDLLQALGAIRRDAKGEWRPTIAGIVLFGTPIALRRCLPMMRVDYIRVPGREWIPDPDRRFDSIELRDPVFRLARRIQAAIVDDLPKAFGLEEGELQRQDKPAIPMRVIREAVVNSLMHRSYRIHSPIQIIRYSNRLEIRNPGFSLKAPEQLGEPGSVLRNPKIAAALHDTRFAETKGSGIRVMREMCERAGLAPPLFESDRGDDQFVMRLFFHHFLGPEDLEWLARFRELHLSDEDARALVVAREIGAMDNQTYREINQIDTLGASQALKKLRDSGLFEQKGRGSATWYQPTPAMLERNTAQFTKPGQLSSDHGRLSSNPRPLSSKLQDDKRRRDMLNELPGELAARVGAIGQRQPPRVVQNLVVELCRQRAFRAEELAVLLARNPETVRQNYLRPLLREHRLSMTRPDVPNDPEQAYIARERHV